MDVVVTVIAVTVITVVVVVVVVVVNFHYSELIHFCLVLPLHCQTIPVIVAQVFCVNWAY
jgi:hypothetical protein